MAKRRSKKRSSRAASPGLTDDLLGHLTDDLVVEILSRLPVKSICRSKCVSRAWRSLIAHPDHRGKLPQTLAGFFYKQLASHESAADLRFANASARAPRGQPLMTFSYSDCQPRCRLLSLIDGCNGLLLLRCRSSTCGDFHYVVCNPATKQWVALPESGQAGHMFVARLGFDPAESPHFHVFEFLEYKPSIPGEQVYSAFSRAVQVYSSSTGGWVHKENGWNGRIRDVGTWSPTVFLKGRLHILTIEYASSSMHATGEHTIAVIDTEGKTQRNIPVPDGPHRLGEGFLHLSQGCLHFVNFERQDGVVRLVVHVLEKYDSQEWTLKHSVESSRVFGGRLFGGTSASVMGFVWVAIHPDCNSIFFNVGRDKTMLRYDMDKKKGRAIKARVICNLDESMPPYLPYVPFYSELEALHM